MSDYTLTTEESGWKADKAIEKVQKRIAEGLIQGKQLPVTVTINGVRIRIEEKEAQDAASPESTQGEATPEATEEAG